MNKKITLGVAGLAIVAGVAGVTASTTYARGGMMRGSGMMGNATLTATTIAQRDAMVAQHDAMEQAILSGDYATWKVAADELEANRPVRQSAEQDKAMTSVITEANFAKFVEMHKLMQQADAIRKELGLDQAGGMGPSMHNVRRWAERGNGIGHRFATSTVATNQ